MATSENEEPAPFRTVSPAKFAHIVLRTRDRYPEMIEWWSRVLGAQPICSTDVMTFLRYDDEHHRMLIVHVPDAEPPTRPAVGMEHLAYTYGSLEDLLEKYKELKSAGIFPTIAVDHGITHGLYYRDPDGHKVELQVDNFTVMDDAVDYLVAAMELNPFGQPFDPEAYIARIAAGATGADIVRTDVSQIAPPPQELVDKLMTA